MPKIRIGSEGVGKFEKGGEDNQKAGRTYFTRVPGEKSGEIERGPFSLALLELLAFLVLLAFLALLSGRLEDEDDEDVDESFFFALPVSFVTRSAVVVGPTEESLECWSDVRTTTLAPPHPEIS